MRRRTRLWQGRVWSTLWQACSRRSRRRRPWRQLWSPGPRSPKPAPAAAPHTRRGRRPAPMKCGTSCATSMRTRGARRTCPLRGPHRNPREMGERHQELVKASVVPLYDNPALTTPPDRNDFDDLGPESPRASSPSAAGASMFGVPASTGAFRAFFARFRPTSDSSRRACRSLVGVGRKVAEMAQVHVGTPTIEVHVSKERGHKEKAAWT